MSNYNKISKEELIRFYWEKIKDKSLTNEASFGRLHKLMEDIKRNNDFVPRIVKLIEQEIKWKKK